MAVSPDSTTVYMLFEPVPYSYGRPIAKPSLQQHYLLGGGSSTPASARIYPDEATAIRMRDRYFPHAEILPITMPITYTRQA